MDILATQLWDTPLNTLHGTNTFPIPNSLFWVDDFPFPKVGYVEFPGGYIEQECFFLKPRPLQSLNLPSWASCLLALLLAWKVPQMMCFFLFPAIRFLTILEKGMSFTNFTNMHCRYSIYNNSVYIYVFYYYTHVIVHVFQTKTCWIRSWCCLVSVVDHFLGSLFSPSSHGQHIHRIPHEVLLPVVLAEFSNGKYIYICIYIHEQIEVTHITTKGSLDTRANIYKTWNCFLLR